ncbi:hypothetical protein ACQ4PT_059574 [Festuca glaucescens]
METTRARRNCCFLLSPHRPTPTSTPHHATRLEWTSVESSRFVILDPSPIRPLPQPYGPVDPGAAAAAAATRVVIPSQLSMASLGVAPASGQRDAGVSTLAVAKLPAEMSNMKIRDEKEVEATIINGNGTETGHIIVTTIGGKDGQRKQTISYMAERVIGQGSFGTVFQAKCLETSETVAIKKVLQDRRYKNREMQMMRLLDHPNVVSLKHCFFSTTEKDELYLNLVLEYVPETVHRVIRHYNKMNQRMPLIYVKLHTYQIRVSDYGSYFGFLVYLVNFTKIV